MNDTASQNRISAAVIKNIALIAMIIDHLTQCLFTPYVLDRGYLPGIAEFISVIGSGLIGRLAMPLFCFLLAEGAYHTGKRGAYLLRLLIAGAAAYVPYCFLTGGLPLHFTRLNIMFSLAAALITIMAVDHADKMWKKILAVLVMCGVSELIRCEYGSAVILTVAAAYCFRDDGSRRVLMSAAGFLAGTLINAVCSGELQQFWIQIPGLLAFVIISKYSGEKGRQLPKWFYYGFYPVHLAVLAAIRFWV